MDNSKILEDIALLKAKIADLEKQIAEIKDSSQFTGVYLDGCQPFVTDYILGDKNKKDGE